MSSTNGWTIRDNNGGWTIVDRAGKSVCASSSNSKRPWAEKVEIANTIVKTPELLAIREQAQLLFNRLIEQGVSGDLVTNLGLALLDYNA